MVDRNAAWMSSGAAWASVFALGVGASWESAITRAPAGSILGRLAGCRDKRLVQVREELRQYRTQANAPLHLVAVQTQLPIVEMPTDIDQPDHIASHPAGNRRPAAVTERVVVPLGPREAFNGSTRNAQLLKGVVRLHRVMAFPGMFSVAPHYRAGFLLIDDQRRVGRAQHRHRDALDYLSHHIAGGCELAAQQQLGAHQQIVEHAEPEGGTDTSCHRRSPALGEGLLKEYRSARHTECRSHEIAAALAEVRSIVGK